MKPDAYKVRELIRDARSGTLVLPGFQRSFIWDRQAVEEFLVSMLNGYFVGTILLLRVADDDAPFEPRLVEGMDETGSIDPDELILDGQQRITSVHYALFAPDIGLKGTTYPYRFLLDIEEAVAGNWEDAVYSESPHWTDVDELLDDRKRQYEENVLPFPQLRSWEVWDRWKDGYRDYKDERGTLDSSPYEELGRLGRGFLNFEIAGVELGKDTSEETVVEVFERINRTGEPLSIFELLTARLWQHTNLRELLEDSLATYPTLEAVTQDKQEKYPRYILQIVALLRGVEPKRKRLILLKGENFPADWEEASRLIEQALNRLQSSDEGGYGVIPDQTPPYSTMVPPLAYLLGVWEDEYSQRPDPLNKIHRWYWSSVFKERYGGSTATVIQRDVTGLEKWFSDDTTIPEAVATEDQELEGLDLLGTVRQGAVYKGVLSLVALEGARDFYTGDTIALHKLDDHHIFPRSYLKGRGVEQDRRNTILNRTLITRPTNQTIQNKQPSQYLAEMESRHGSNTTQQILNSHYISVKAHDALRQDDYSGFLAARAESIKAEIVRRCLQGR